MKKIKLCITLVLTCAIFVATSSFAAARASAQIDYYMINAKAIGDGEIAIMFSVTAPNFMEEIGAESIYIYERATLGWDLADIMDKDDPGMTAHDAIKHGTTVYFNGETGKEYRVIVTVFAEDKDGESDSRSKTITLTA